jgi:hypothetical protein
MSLAWNVVLVLGVIANQSFAHTRAAGGQFESFPTGIRIAYILNLTFVVYQGLILLTAMKRPRFVLLALTVLEAFSIFVNALSRSSAERWNAIPAAVIAYALLSELREARA